MIKRFRERCDESGMGEGVLRSSLRDAFAELEQYVPPRSSTYPLLMLHVRIVLECTVTLQKCKVLSERKRDRLRLILKRSELTQCVKDCSSKMSKAHHSRGAVSVTISGSGMMRLGSMRLASRSYL